MAIVTSSLLIAAAPHAQSLPPPSSAPAAGPALTLAQAFRLALGHPLIQQRQGNIGAAEEDIRAAEWRRFPTLSVDSSRALGSQPAGAANSDQNAATVRVQQPLWSGGRISADIDAAQIRRGVAALALEETEQDLLQRVAQSYSDALRLQERAAVAADNVREHQRLYELIGRRLEQEIASEADVSLARARFQQSKTELLTFQAAARNSRSTLEQLVGQPLGGARLQALAARRLAWSGGEAALDAARRYSPTLRRLDTEVDLARADVKSKKAQILPQLALRYEQAAGSASTVPFHRWLLTLEYQPGAGLSALPGMDAAVKRVAVAQSAHEAGGRELADKVAAQYNEAEAFAAQLDPTNQYADAATAVMDSYLRQYKAGRKSWLEVFNAQREMAQARYTAIDTTAGITLSAYKLDILTGRVNRANLADATPERAATTRPMP